MLSRHPCRRGGGDSMRGPTTARFLPRCHTPTPSRPCDPGRRTGPSRSGPCSRGPATCRQTTLASELEPVRKDGAAVVLVVPDEVTPTPVERRLADVVVRGPLPPAPFGLLVALAAADVPDVRRLGLLGGSRDALEAGRRAGAGAVIGLRQTAPRVDWSCSAASRPDHRAGRGRRHRLVRVRKRTPPSRARVAQPRAPR